MSAEINELVGDILTPPGFDDFLDALPWDFEGLDFEDGFLHAQAADQAILSGPIPDYGRSSPSWLSFLKKFASATVYSKRVDTFLQWHHNVNVPNMPLESSIVEYFEFCNELTNDQGESVYSAGWSQALSAWIVCEVIFEIFLRIVHFLLRMKLYIS